MLTPLRMKLSIAATSLLLSGPLFGSITILFSEDGSPGPILSGLTTSTGTEGTSGLQWGIVVDTVGIGFDDLTVGPATTISDDADFGNGRRYFNGGLTEELTAGDKSGETGNGAVVAYFGDPYASAAISTSSTYAMAIIWFDLGLTSGASLEAGSKYGIITPADVGGTMNLPADTAFTSYAPLFLGDDPARTAGLQFIPEPSTAILAMLGALGIFRRRR